MRISILREREAFADIVAATLRKFWNQRYQQEFHLTWAAGRPANQHSTQTWFCNNYLNCIFLSHTTSAAFGPIRDEFGSSIHRWRTPLQKAYVALATNPVSSRWFAHQRLLVSPPIPPQPEQLVVPGNTKIRLLSASQRTTWVVLKARFNVASFLTEIEHRQMATDAGVPVPAIERVDADHAWFCEQYIRGTPANRLPRPEEQSRITQRGYAAILPLVESTLQSVPTHEYKDDLAARFRGVLQQLHCVPDEIKRRLEDAAKHLLARTSAATGDVVCSQTHGDFQPGNVLLEGNHVWIIDWEYAGRRMAVYDPLVMGLASRFSTGLADRIRDFIEYGPGSTGGHWPGVWPAELGKDPVERAHLAAFFLLEELILHVRENAKPPITTAGQGLHEMLRQVERSLELTEPR